MNGHWKTDDFLDRLYGLDQVGVSDRDAHLESCADCRNRWSEMRRKKTVLSKAAPVSSDFLAAQRRKIYSRLDEQPRTRMAWAPALAAAALLAIGIAVYRPAATPASQHLDAADAQLFAEVYSMEQSVEPSVATPIHTLFEEIQ
jgi:predicted anti-sigma-YlaC factor YlaD